MTCAEFKEQVALLASGALEAEERAALEAHLSQPTHEGCIETLARANRAATALGRALPPVPVDERVWKGIEAKLNAAPPGRRGPPAWPGWLAAAAALIAVAWLAHDRANFDQQLATLEKANGTQAVQLQQAQASVAKSDALCSLKLAQARVHDQPTRDALALLQQKDTRVLELVPAGPKQLRATAIVNERLQHAYVFSTALPAQPGKDYELWTVHGKRAPEPAGLMHAEENGVMLGEFDPKLLAQRPDALAISIEKAGGASSPTDVEMLVKLGT